MPAEAGSLAGALPDFGSRPSAADVILDQPAGRLVPPLIPPWPCLALALSEGSSMSALFLAALLAAAPPSAGTHLAYQGALAPVKDDGNPAVKKFALSYVVLPGAPAG